MTVAALVLRVLVVPVLVVAVLGIVVGRAQPSFAAGAGYASLAEPARVADTRIGGTTVDGVLAGGGRLAANVPLEVRIAGRATVPANAVTAVLNVTAVSPTADAYLTVYPCGSPVPNTSNLNVRAGEVVANAAIARLGSQGAACVVASVPTDVLVDVAGYFVDSLGVVPLSAPVRLADTRRGASTVDGVLAGGGRVAAGTSLAVRIAGRSTVPNNATTAILNVTAVQPSAEAYLTVYPCGSAVPNASSLNARRSDVVAGFVMARIGTSSSVCIYASVATDVIVDVAGYLVDASVFSPLTTPARILDTRAGAATFDGRFAGTGMFADQHMLELPIAGRAGVPANATAVVLTLTSTGQPASGYATVHPPGTQLPNASNLNFSAGVTRANSVVVRLGSTGSACLYNEAASHMIVDVAGYLVGGTPVPASTCPNVVAAPQQRANADRPDDISGPQVHLIYVLPSDGSDLQRDTDGSIARSIGLAQNWLASESGGQRIRLDTYNGRPDITFARLAKSDATIAAAGAYVRELIERGLRDAGRLDPNKLYVAFYEGTSDYSCGAGAYPPELVGNLVSLHLQGLPNNFPTCGSQVLGAVGATRPGYLDISIVHEVFHALGGVPTCAPNNGVRAHVSDRPDDLMWTGDAPWDVDNMRLDIGRNDYFGHGRPDCLDVARSAFLTPTLGAGELPPLWGTTPSSDSPFFG